MGPVFKVDAEKCRKDGICSNICPVRLIDVDETGLPVFNEARASQCLGCGHCVAFCPHGASSLEGLPAETCEKIDRKLMPSVESTSLLMRSRRSVRSFSDKLVDRESIDKILEMVSYAPTAKNMRDVRWVMVNSAEQVKKLSDLLTDGLAAYANTEPATVEKRGYKMLVNAYRKGNDVIFRGAKQVAVAISKQSGWWAEDCSVALSYFELAANSMNIGCCWAGYFTAGARMLPELKDFLGLADDEIVGGAQMFGYNKIKISYVPPRKNHSVNWLE